MGGDVVGRGRAGSPGSGGAPSPYLRRGFLFADLKIDDKGFVQNTQLP
jgi:hypothetical protein